MDSEELRKLRRDNFLKRTGSEEAPMPSLNRTLSDTVEKSREKNERLAKMQVGRTIAFLVAGILTGLANPIEVPITNFMLAFCAANFLTVTNNLWTDDDKNVPNVTILIGLMNALKEVINDICVYV
jgi:hypothetical protein